MSVVSKCSLTSMCRKLCRSVGYTCAKEEEILLIFFPCFHGSMASELPSSVMDLASFHLDRTHLQANRFIMLGQGCQQPFRVLEMNVVV